MFKMGDGVAQGKTTCYYETNGGWALNRQKQDQTRTDGGSNPLVLQKLRKGKCLPAVTQEQIEAPGSRCGMNINQLEVDFGIRTLFLQRSPQEQVLFSSYLEGLPSPWTSYNSLLPGPKTHAHKGFPKPLSLQL